MRIGMEAYFDDLKQRGLEQVGLIVADGITGLDSVVGESFPGTPLQRCVTHLKRNMICRVRHGDKNDLAEDLRRVFKTGDENYTVEMCWQAWRSMCDKWGADYRSIKRMGQDPSYKAYMTYLNYHPRIQSMINTTNWIERLQRDFRRVTRMRGAMPNDESVIVLMGRTAMDKTSYSRTLPGIQTDTTLFPKRERKIFCYI